MGPVGGIPCRYKVGVNSSRSQNALFRSAWIYRGYTVSVQKTGPLNWGRLDFSVEPQFCPKVDPTSPKMATPSPKISPIGPQIECSTISEICFGLKDKYLCIGFPYTVPYSVHIYMCFGAAYTVPYSVYIYIYVLWKLSLTSAFRFLWNPSQEVLA